MKKSKNVVREALAPVLTTLVAVAVVLVGLHFGSPVTTEAERKDLSGYVSPDWEKAEKIDQTQFVSQEALERFASQVDIKVEDVSLFVRNSKGQIVGSEAFATCREEVPDLISVGIMDGENGTIFGDTPDGWLHGFVFATDFYCEETTNAYQNYATSVKGTMSLNEEVAQRGKRMIPVYDIEGEVVLGMIEVGYSTWPGA